ncbi:uncharacterized protein ACLA_049890 [Aspergillus clavatus NRRL 1]|uniref:Prenylcysteine lyase domain-containing protein n=1 Tax=Aspergillus clavatus (strain ATCC 1007 / CBS 513.65 / DSM 816 / NCTC 3887 / NRRL 1 / QM 1276 / 107) TaxID=344612 RepID=A1CI12_ASPCL|nr:uncharacterized protein ACLA_049890 [Aspergillus clavatus NRRL 1]EAW10517.1 hypothetical protein ACLA_049890 [Aspergillus clavatus NRRL 1]
MSSAQSKGVAIGGGGCAGVTALYALQRSPHDVHLFEASHSLGGRMKTISIEFNGNRGELDKETPILNATASRQCILP